MKLIIVLLGVLAAMMTPKATGGFEPAQDRRHERTSDIPMQEGPLDKLSRKQQERLLKSRLEQMKQDAAELADLAKSLQEDIETIPENVFSLQVVDKAEKIEKLAKRIKNNAKGY